MTAIPKDLKKNLINYNLLLNNFDGGIVSIMDY